MRIPFTFNKNSVTSSFTLGIAVYSCKTPSILTHVTAVPGTELNRTLRNGFARVTPKPGGKGSIINFPYKFSFISTEIDGVESISDCFSKSSS